MNPPTQQDLTKIWQEIFHVARYVRRFASFVAVKEKTIRTYPEYCWHLTLSINPFSRITFESSRPAIAEKLLSIFRLILHNLLNPAGIYLRLYHKKNEMEHEFPQPFAQQYDEYG